MNEKPQFYIEIWCHAPKGGINEQIYKIFPLPRIYDDKEDIEKHMEDILKEYVEFCKQKGNRKPSSGQIFNEREYHEKIKDKSYTPH
jgi:hypothetical protein